MVARAVPQDGCCNLHAGWSLSLPVPCRATAAWGPLPLPSPAEEEEEEKEEEEEGGTVHNLPCPFSGTSLLWSRSTRLFLELQSWDSLGSSSQLVANDVEGPERGADGMLAAVLRQLVPLPWGEGVTIIRSDNWVCY